METTRRNEIFLRVQPSYPHCHPRPFDLSNRVKKGMKKERDRRWSSGMRQRIQGWRFFERKFLISSLEALLRESPGESKTSTFFQKNASDLFLAPRRLPRLPCDLLFHRFITSLSLSLFSLSLSLSFPFVAQFHLIRFAPTKSRKLWEGKRERGNSLRGIQSHYLARETTSRLYADDALTPSGLLGRERERIHHSRAPRLALIISSGQTKSIFFRMEKREWEWQISREEYISRDVERAMNSCEDSNNASETLERRIVEINRFAMITVKFGG